MLAAALCSSLIALGGHIVVPWLLARNSSAEAARRWSLLAVPLTLLAALPWILLLSGSALPHGGSLPNEVKLGLVLTLGLLVCDLAVTALQNRFDRATWGLAATVGLIVTLALGHALFSLGLGLDRTGLDPVIGELGEQGWVEGTPTSMSVRPSALGSFLRSLFVLPVVIFAAAPLVALIGAPPPTARTALSQRTVAISAAVGLVLLYGTLPLLNRQVLMQANDHLTLISAALLMAATPWLARRMAIPVALMATVLTAVFLSRVVG